MEKSVVGYMHVALMNGLGGLASFMEMHARLLQSGMYARADRINLSRVSQGADQYASYSFIKENVLRHFTKYAVRYESSNVGDWEWPAIRTLQSDVLGRTDSHAVWYLHTKGVSNGYRDDVHAYVQRNIHMWRSVMSHEVMDHVAMLEILEEHGAAGPLYREESPRHFSGNFWWARSEYIGTIPMLPVDTSPSRNEAETWIGTGSGTLQGSTAGETPHDIYDFSGQFIYDGGPLAAYKGWIP